MSSATLWTILVPTIGQREALFRRLMETLLPQLDEHEGTVRVLAWRNSGQPRLAELRDYMIAEAQSEYVNFIDDDDLVPDYYVAEVVRALASRPDHVGFRMEYHTDDQGALGFEIVEHSVRHRKWGRTADGMLYRDLTHVDPIRTEIARRGRFAAARPRRAEDRVWVRQVRDHVRTEEFVDKVMYYYLWSRDTSAWERPELIAQATTPLPAIEHPFFSWHPSSI